MTENKLNSANANIDNIQVSLLDSGSQLRQTETAQKLYLLLDVRPPANVQSQNNLPLNISLVIDRSTSMKGDRINKVKAAVAHIIDKLSSQDFISIVTFSDRADIVVPSIKPESTSDLLSRINGIMPSGGTEIFQGLAAAYREIRKVELDKHVNHIILLTDGHTYGDSELCLDLAEKAAQLGIGISGFGIGHEWNDSFLDSLVSISGGQSAYIQEPEQIIHLLRQHIQDLGTIYAHNTRIKFDVPEYLSILQAFKLTPFFQPLKIGKDQISAGAIEGRTSLGVLIEIEVSQLIPDVKISIPLTIQAEIPAGNPPGVSIKIVHNVQINSSSLHLTRPLAMPSIMLESVRMLNLYRMNEAIWQDIGDGKADNVVRRMDFLTKRFEEAGMDQLAKNVRQNTRVFQSGDTLSEGGRMNIKYGTRLQLTTTLQNTIEQKG
jgi:Ca-activated chloride channel family protein